MSPPFGASSMDDFDSFIDFNGGVDSSNYAPEEPQHFSGPSFEYDRFRQQTGFPSGSMSSVSALNDISMDADGAGPTDFANYNSGVNFSFDGASSSNQNYFFSQQTASSSNTSDDFVDPTAVYGHAAAPVRMWPGMHSQQAERAKAATLASQQHQPQRPSLVSQMSMSSQQKRRSVSVTDPVAERKISDLLNNMREKSMVSPIEEEDGDADGDYSRSRRDEEDMDEDERLLASEEGKKLSSKERRQLRNKVSARAFRSRRKEYISQLEGDLAGKTNEAQDLRIINRKLLEENNQLKNLTRTLLGHPAFQSFLEDMSRTQTFVPPPPGMLASIGAIPRQQEEVKQEPEPMQSQQEEVQVGMTQIPQESLDISMLNLGTSHWAPQGNNFGFQRSQVFALYDLPSPTIAQLAPARITSDKVKQEFSFESLTRPATKDTPAPIEFPSTSHDSSKMAPRSSVHHDTDSTAQLSHRPLTLRNVSPIEQVNTIFDRVEPLRLRVEELSS